MSATPLQHAVVKATSAHELLRQAIRSETREFFGLEVLEGELLATVRDLREYRSACKGHEAAHSPFRLLSRTPGE